VKFGISFTTTHLNQAGALVHVYTDGSISLNHGGTEMGQGLNIKVAQVVADAFQVPLAAVKITSTRTDKVPNTSATAASSGSDLNGMAALHACEQIKDRLAALRRATFGARPVYHARRRAARRAADELQGFVNEAYLARDLALGRRLLPHPGHPLRPRRPQGRPFYYYAYGAACSEVVVDTLTGENRSARGHPPRRRPLAEPGHRPRPDRGRLHPGHGLADHRGAGVRRDGRLTTHAPSTYKIPTAGDRPDVFNMAIWAPARTARHHPPLQGRGRAAADAGDLGVLAR
jgi:xanthine dehydrogenase large subunit